MASIDGSASSEEEEMIKKTISSFEENSKDLNETYNKVKKGEYGKEEVYELLRRTREVMTSEAILIMIAELARMILADGKIDQEEEKLMKNFMLIAGISEDLYETILDKVKK